jgi:hypothetical protein
MTISNQTVKSNHSRPVVWLPKRLSGCTWEEVGARLGVFRTGHTSEAQQAACQVTIPAGWNVVNETFFKRWLIDESGKRRAMVIYKEYRADFMQLVDA